VATVAEHKKDCIQYLGEPFEEVHKWLDEFAVRYPVHIFDDQHRKYRHHKVGVEQVRKLWGDRAAMAAELHIIRDLFGYIPKDYSLGDKVENNIS
jgi:hypothetical protein